MRLLEFPWRFYFQETETRREEIIPDDHSLLLCPSWDARSALEHLGSFNATHQESNWSESEIASLDNNDLYKTGSATRQWSTRLEIYWKWHIPAGLHTRLDRRCNCRDCQDTLSHTRRSRYPCHPGLEVDRSQLPLYDLWQTKGSVGASQLANQCNQIHSVRQHNRLSKNKTYEYIKKWAQFESLSYGLWHRNVLGRGQ